MVVKPDYEHYKSFFYNLTGLLLLVGGVGYNVFTVPLLQKYGVLPQLEAEFPHRVDFLWLMPVCWSMLMLGCGGIMIFARRKISWFFNESIFFNVWLLLGLIALLLTSNVVAPGHYRLARVLLVLVLMFTLTNAFYQLAVKDQKKHPLHPYWKNLTLVVYAVLMVSLLLEMMFMFVARPHRYNGSLASRNWFSSNWKVNQMGFRDAGWDENKLKNKKLVLFAGDSFTAGHGVKDPADRFSDRMAAKLPASYLSLNVAYPGADTRDALTYLKQVNGETHWVIYQWYPNDIDQAGKDAGLDLTEVTPYDDVPAPFAFFVQRSYLLNFLYWLYPRKSENVGYLGYLKKCYADKKTIGIHLADLEKIIAWTEEKNAKLVVVMFPFLEDVKGSAAMMQPVRDFLQERNVTVVDMSGTLLPLSPAETMVNKNDGHPNEKVHAMVADSLWNLAQREHILE